MWEAPVFIDRLYSANMKKRNISLEVNLPTFVRFFVVVREGAMIDISRYRVLLRESWDTNSGRAKEVSAVYGSQQPTKASDNNNMSCHPFLTIYLVDKTFAASREFTILVYWFMYLTIQPRTLVNFPVIEQILRHMSRPKGVWWWTIKRSVKIRDSAAGSPKLKNT